MRRALTTTTRRAVAVAMPLTAARTAVSTTVRDDLSRVATKVKEEANGQALDLADMADAARASMKAVQDASQRHPDGGGDAKVKGKLQTLQASLKAYQNRLNNLQTEAKSINREAETLVKHIWGTESSASPAGGNVKEAEDFKPVEDFDAEAPHVAKILENADQQPPQQQQTQGSGSAAEEPEVLEIEIETPEEDIPITTITQELYEKGIDFSDCNDADALRQRYCDMKAGKFDKQEPPKQQQQQYAPPQRPTYDQQQQQHQQWGGQQQQQQQQSSETGLAFDPHPGAMRKMIDPMKYVWQVKADVARDNGVDANTVDLWSGPIKLEDHKRLYDYGPNINANPIEVRQKGDTPNYNR